MTATAVIVRPGSVPQVADATVGAPAPAVDDLPPYVSSGSNGFEGVFARQSDSSTLSHGSDDPSGGDAHPAANSRDFFNGCTVSFDLPRYEAMVGPLTATPDRSLADVVREVAGP